MVPDFYRRIGLPRSATKVDIELAYERMCLKYRCHSFGRFNLKLPASLEEAFSVLLDAEAKKHYDAALRSEQADLEVQDRSQIEPVSLCRSFARVTPSLRAVLSHIHDNFGRAPSAGSVRAQTLTMEILLTPDEAGRGGVIPVEIPSYRRCPRCRGTGLDGFVACDACENEGVVPDFAVLQVEYPKGLVDGAVIRRDLRHLGISNLEVVLKIRITPTIPEC